MPKIAAPTVAEHHAAQRAALLQAGRTLIATKGAEAVTPGAVGTAAGLARSSVYQYFPTRTDLLAAIIEEAFTQASAAATQAVAHHTEPADRLVAHVRTSFALATAAEHRGFDGLDLHAMPADVRDRIHALHLEQVRPLIDACRDLGAPDPALAAGLIGGMLSAAARAVTAGAEPAATLAALLHAIHAGPLAPRPDSAAPLA